MNLIQYVLIPFGATKDSMTVGYVFSGITVSVLAIVWLAFTTPMTAFIHLEVTAFAALGFFFITMEFRILFLLTYEIKKIVEIFSNALLNENLYLIEIGKINFGLIISIFLFTFQSILNYYVCINSAFLNEVLHQGKFSSLYYLNCFIANFYALGLMYASIYTCFEIRRRYHNIYIKRCLHDDLTKNIIMSRVDEFLDFYNNSRLDLIGYVKQIEICNIIILVLYNFTLVMCNVSMYKYNDQLIFIILLLISLTIIDLYFLIMYLIIWKKTRVTRSLIVILSQLKRKRRVMMKIVVVDSIEENCKHEHVEQDYNDEIQIQSFATKSFIVASEPNNSSNGFICEVWVCVSQNNSL